MTKANLSRRDFLKKGGVLSGAALTLGGVRAVHAAGNGRIKIGLIGCGNRGPGALADCLRSGRDVEVVALGDYFSFRNEAVLAAMKENFPDQVNVPAERMFTGFSNYRGVLDSGIDAVLIACAAKFHPAYAEAAIRSGIHVFVEKPHAIDAAGVHQVEATIALAREKKLSLVSGLQSRFSYPHQALVEQIHAGGIGEIVSAECKFLRAPYRLTAARPGMTELETQINNQYHFRWMSGDDFPQSLVHNVDRITWATGGDYPQDATGMGGRASMFTPIHGDVFDHHCAFFRYKNERRLYGLCRTEDGCFNEYDDIIFGTKGYACCNDAKIVGEKNWKYEGQANGSHAQVQFDFMDALRKGERLDCGDYMAKSTMMGILGQMACYTGNRITWDECYGSKFQIGPPVEEFHADMPTPSVPGPDGCYSIPIPGEYLWRS